jgi:hypothetical protein
VIGSYYYRDPPERCDDSNSGNSSRSVKSSNWDTLWRWNCYNLQLGWCGCKGNRIIKGEPWAKSR